MYIFALNCWMEYNNNKSQYKSFFGLIGPRFEGKNIAKIYYSWLGYSHEDLCTLTFGDGDLL